MRRIRCLTKMRQAGYPITTVIILLKPTTLDSTTPNSSVSFPIQAQKPLEQPTTLSLTAEAQPADLSLLGSTSNFIIVGITLITNEVSKHVTLIITRKLRSRERKGLHFYSPLPPNLINSHSQQLDAAQLARGWELEQRLRWLRMPRWRERQL